MHPTLATLMVAHDAFEAGDAAARVRLLDELVDCTRTRHTFSRRLYKAEGRVMRRYPTSRPPFRGRPPWWHNTAWGGDGRHGTGGRRTVLTTHPPTPPLEAPNCRCSATFHDAAAAGELVDVTINLAD